MKKYVLALTLLLCLAGCAAAPAVGESASPSPAIPDSPEPSPTTAATPTPSAPTPAPSAPAEDPMLLCYERVLRGLKEDLVYPDGEPLPFDTESGIWKPEDLAKNQYAIADVDGDGKEELIFHFSTCAMAGMAESVYGYDAEKDEVYRELWVFPAVTYYDNGLARVEASHNHSMSNGDFWPWALYEYDEADDSYQLAWAVSAWAEEIEPEGYPHDVDAEGAGQVYYVMEGGWREDAEPISQSAYQAWLADVMGEGNEVEVSFQKLG